ncbi:MAG: peptidylprolyl isomerase [Chitinophagaceae bacterium]|jgi:peptidyl-prolyl cis-trans isomerase SurA|nr:peptidylprolyl isomerase [Chitinophagaceae bacterium]
MTTHYLCSDENASDDLRYTQILKKMVTLSVSLFFVLISQSQTLLTLGDHKVDIKEFRQAYQKNTNAVSYDKQSINEYLQLYINSKLKIREAYNRGYDTLPQQREELINLRSQIIDNYMNDPETMDKLVMEAFERSQKEIEIAHIYIGINDTKGEPDTTDAFNKINTAFQELKTGTPFHTVALRYSQDPDVTTNQGNIGYITVFNLPYNFENIVYTLPVQQFSSPYRSKNGYHIFKNLGERKSMGYINAWQVLLALPPGANETIKQNTKALADSLYKRLVAGDDKENMATIYSNDFISAQAGGKMPEFSVGQYDPVFENTVIALPLNTFSKPFETAYGFHIVNKLSVTPVITDVQDTENMLALRTRVNQSDRIETLKLVIHEKVKKQAGFQMLPTAEKEWLWITDSILENRQPPSAIQINRETPFIKIGEQIFSIQNWLDYAQLHRYKPGSSGQRAYEEILEDYKIVLSNNYYRDHLEDFNPGFANQLNDFKEGNLFFEIMQQEIWNRAQDDSLGLKNYYDQHRAKYTWEKSADAILFYCTDDATAKELRQALMNDPGKWQEVVARYGEKVITDSARYEWAQIPGADTKPLEKGLITSPIINDNDQSASFAYIISIYPQPEPRNFNESRGFILNDYQQHLETQWLNSLRKKYPVKIRQKTLRSLYKK